VNKQWRQRLMVLPPLLFAGIFIYMAFFNSVYEHPGRVIYYSKCASCHGNHGEGTVRLVPPIYNTATLRNNFDALPCLILQGMKDSILVSGQWYNQPMYPIALSSVEMSNLLNYIRDSLMTDKTDRLINSQWVEEQTKSCSK